MSSKLATANEITHSASTRKHINVLSRLVLLGHSQNPNGNLSPVHSDLEYVSGLNDDDRVEFLRLANTHHVTVRALEALETCAITAGDDRVQEWCNAVLSSERSRINHAIQFLAPICNALESAGAKVTVIKSLDHWPDLGSDLDLYTSGDPSTVIQVMSETFDAKPESRSWGDRLANKWNFSIPGLPELIEIHVRYLGQTGEHRAMALRVAERRVTKTVNGCVFQVPAPEERVIISTLQRMYRHFYFRLCDMADFSALPQSRAIDFVELRKAARMGGVWPGVATFLFLVSEYAKSFGANVEVPHEVLASAYSHEVRVHLGGDFLRVPKGPAAGLYRSQLLNASRNVDFRAISRLPLLPPLAICALIAFRLTGSDKGVW